MLDRIKNSFKYFQTNYNYDWTPGITKIITLTVMPIACIVFLYASYYYNNLSNKSIQDLKFIQGSISEIRKVEYETKKNETTSYSLIITVDNSNYSLSSAFLNDKSNITLNDTGKVASIYYELEKNVNKILALKINNQESLKIDDVNRHYKGLRNITLIFGGVFTIWFLSRVYRYKKFGSLN